MPVVVQGKSFGLAVMCVACCVAAAAAQARSAVLEGTIRDASTAVIASAAVTLRDRTTNQARSTASDARGAYRFTDVPVGEYEVLIAVDGFEPYRQPALSLTIGQTARLDVTLQAAGLVEQVVVSAQPPPLDPRQTASTTTVDAERIEELPVRSRNYLEFVLLAPGVTRPPRPSSAGPGAALTDSGFSFGGLRPRSNTLTIDGLDNNDEVSGATRTELSLEFIREFQVVTNGWSAENGGAAGGGINVVTKSGANTLHGDVFLFDQSGRVNARPKLEETFGRRPSLQRYRGGLAVGGPLIRDRTFYYVAAERERTSDENAADIGANTAAAINRALGAGLLPDVVTRSVTIGLFPTARRETEVAAKLTHQFKRGDGVAVRAAATRSRDDGNAFNDGGLIDRSLRGSRSTRDTSLTGSWTTILNARSTNELRGQVATRGIDSSSVEPDGAEVAIAGGVSFGAAYLGRSARDQTYLDLADTIAHSRDSHLFKAGGTIRRAVERGDTSGTGGLYAFRALDAFTGGGTPEQFRRFTSTAAFRIPVTRLSAFAQDHWTPLAQLTVDAGVRFDTSRFPSSLAIINRQISPRLGVAWMAASRWVIRGGAGFFADRLVLAALERAVLSAEHHVNELVIRGVEAAPSTYRVRSGVWQPSSRQAAIGVERQLTTNLTAAVNYLFVAGRRLPRTVNVNLLPPTVLTEATASALGIDTWIPQQLGRPIFGRARRDPSWDGVFEVQPTAASTHHAMTVAVNKRLANELEWAAAYTWSHTRDSASDFDEQPQNPDALDAEWSDSRFDQRHRLVIHALFDVPIGEEEDRAPGEVPGPLVRAFSHIEAAPILTIASGHPANAMTGGDDNRSGAFPFTSRPLGLPRNGLRLPATATLDLRILKYFPIKPHGKLDLVVEIFNVLNRTNVTEVNAVYGPGLQPLRTFGRAIEAASARQFQFSVDFEF